ncbi:MAG: integrase [Myxococcaceae bacterium]|nr:integrase [Myxococcaceae bacterium]
MPEILPTDRTANELAPAEPSSIVPELGPLVSSAASYARSARAERTLKEYAKQWATFTAWCAEHGLCELPAAPQTLCLYLAARADLGRRVATLDLALTAISQARAIRLLAGISSFGRPGKAFGAGLA